MLCNKCNLDKSESDFSVHYMSGDRIYYHKQCKQCRRSGRIKPLISPDDEKKILANSDDYGKIHGAEFYEKAGLKMGIQSFYRYGRLGVIKKMIEKKEPIPI